MSTETEQLVVQLEARVRDFERNFQKASKTANDNWRNIENRGRQASTRIQSQMAKVAGGIGNSFRNMGLSLAGSLGAAVSAKAISEAAQQYVNLQNALKVAGVEGEALEHTFADLFKIAQQNGTPIESLVTLYSRATQAQKELKASSGDLLQFTNGVSLALRVAGTSAQQASGALLQLSQLLGSGTVRAEEFNSVNEGARPILQAVAAGLKEAGNSVATLKNLVNDGKVSSEAFFRAFLAGMPMLEESAAKAQGTISQAISRVGNAFIVLVGELDKTTDASKNATENLNKVADAISRMPDYLHAASKGLSELKSWLHSVGTLPIWDRINKFFGVDGEAANKRFREMIGATNDAPSSAQTTKSPAPAVAIKPVSLKSFPISGKDKDTGGGVDEVETYIKQLERTGRVLEAEYQTLGKTNAERKKAIELARIGNVADAEQANRIGQLVDANEAVRRKIEAVRQAQEGLRDAAKFAGDEMTQALTDVIVDGEKASDAISNLIRALARAAIQAALVGSGPLAGLFGMASASGGVGGLLGAAFGGFRAGGGPVEPGRAYVVGERGKEVFMPSVPGMIVPRVANLGGGAIGISQNITVNVTGSAGTEKQNNDLAAKIAGQLGPVAQSMVGKEIRRQMRPGGLLAVGR